jgi:hypothetical protein
MHFEGCTAVLILNFFGRQSINELDQMAEILK